MNICVVGSGYVGLVTGACLADFGMHVTGVDKDANKVAALKRGEIPIYEPGLATLVRKNAEQGRLSFTTESAEAIATADAVFIAVGTPPAEDGSADLTFVREVARAIGEHLNGFTVIITKSTVPIGTGKMIDSIVRQVAGEAADFAVVSNPEFLREGSAIEDFMRPDRVVIGTSDERAAEIMLQVYAPLQRADVPFVVTNVESAELIKYASNGFLATKISFINEVADLCEGLGADVEVVARGMGLDQRIGPKFLSPGPGFGGSCFPKDTRAVASIAEQTGRRFRIIEAVLEVNQVTQQRMVEKTQQAFGGVAGKTLAVLGLSFKPDTDDVRESPALHVVERLLAAGAHLRAFDPAAMEAFREVLDVDTETAGRMEYTENAYAAAEGADGLVILTEWNQFRALELSRLKEVLARPLVVDLRNLYDPAVMAAAGLRYVSVGRPEGIPATPESTTPEGPTPENICEVAS